MFKEKKIIAKTKNKELVHIKKQAREHYMFSHISLEKDLIITPGINLKYKFELNPYTYLPYQGKSSDKEKEDIKAQQKKLNEEKQFLIIQLYKCMLKNKSFIIPNFIRYNSRYDKEFNYYALMVPYEYLDAKHIFLKLMYSNFFNHNWKYFFNNYDRLESYLKDNLSARQMLISFVSEYGKINKLWKNKKFKWIIQETPYFYLRILRVTRYLDEDNLKKYFVYKLNVYKQSTYCDNSVFDFNHVSFSNNLSLTTPSLNRKLKKKSYRKKKKAYKRKMAIVKVGNGMLNSTMSIVNLFNNKPTEIFITNNFTHRQVYSELYNFIFLVNNMHLKFISTNSSLIMRDSKNKNDIIIPNMKYATRMVRNFEEQTLNINKHSSSEVYRYIEKLTFYLDRIKNKRTREFIKIKLEDIYMQYKLR